MRRIRLSFERGGELTVGLNGKTPRTVSRLLEALPFTGDIVHTRWCGREISCALPEGPLAPAPKENCTCSVSKFDVAYWRDWDNPEPLPEAPGAEAIALYYGAERLAYHNGLLHVNVIGRVAWEQEELLDEIGERIWKRGIEKVRAEYLAEQDEETIF